MCYLSFPLEHQQGCEAQTWKTFAIGFEAQTIKTLVNIVYATLCPQFQCGHQLLQRLHLAFVNHHIDLVNMVTSCTLALVDVLRRQPSTISLLALLVPRPKPHGIYPSLLIVHLHKSSQHSPLPSTIPVFHICAPQGNRHDAQHHILTQWLVLKSTKVDHLLTITSYLNTMCTY